ncbi:MAG: DUF2079 domain-containing protein [Spirulinaceae cyanobacterium SM2_1_0]|nr:DUF2079 domain-containing protein [Spirulinaceae cyanobacterium SM2_1_0]
MPVIESPLPEKQGLDDCPASWRSRPLVWRTPLVALLLFLCSSARHLLFHSTAFDLTHFDQAVYLIGQPQPAIVSLTEYHFLGSHADWILYLLAPLYWLYPSVYWLFAVQAGALAIAALPLWQLARDAGLSLGLCRAVVWAYWLYPLVFNINLFDFHPSVLAVPLLLAAVLAARRQQVGWFTVAVVLLLGCRAALSLTAIGLGFWLLVAERRRRCGAIALLLGSLWLVLATQWIIPTFSTVGVEALGRYGFLGNSLPEIALNLFLRPDLVLPHLLTAANLEYLALLLLPLVWGLSLRHLTPLLAAAPDLLLNLLADYPLQKDLLHQYSLPILPFLLLAAIASLAHRRFWWQRPRWIVLWSLVGFLALAKPGYFWTRYLETLETWSATRAAIAQVDTPGRLLTSAQIAPHLSHRPVVKLATMDAAAREDLTAFDYILLNQPHPGWNSTPELVTDLRDRLSQQPEFRLRFDRDGVVLFVRADR